MIPDYREVSTTAAATELEWSRAAGLVLPILNDLVTLSRFRWDTLVYSQNRVGYTMPQLGPLQWQLTWVANFTADRNHEVWANFSIKALE